MKIITVGSYLCHLMALISVMPLLGGRELIYKALAMEENEEKKNEKKQINRQENLRTSETKEKEEEKETVEKEEKKQSENEVEMEVEEKEKKKEDGVEPSAPKEEVEIMKEEEEILENEDKEKEGEIVEDEGKEKTSSGIKKLKSAIRKLSCIDSMRVASMMLGAEEEKEGESLKSAFKPVSCMEEKKIMMEYVEGKEETIPDGIIIIKEEEEEEETYKKEEKEKKEVEEVDRNNIVEGPEILKEGILGSDYKNIQKPAILINIWPLVSRKDEKVAKILSLEIVDESKMMGSYYKIKIEGKEKEKEGVPLLVNKGAGDEVMKMKERQFKFITEIRSDEVPELKKLLLKKSEGRQISKNKESAFDLDFPREMVGEDEVDERINNLIEKRKEMYNPFKKYYYGYKKYRDVEESTPSEKMTPESDVSSMEKSGSSRGIGILMGEFSEDDIGEREMLEEEIRILAEEI